ncbi:MAG: Fe2+-dependent dioxygenase [Alphaproteobacteria bacterium]|nr:Fe2+-dependent dioxygenase [Alphaproteobacteria bacterium]
MIMEIEDLLPPDSRQAIAELLEDRALFRDGGRTAGRMARARKNNLQAADHPLVRGILTKVRDAVMTHPVVQMAAVPNRIARVLLSRYEPGMAYGTHVDNAFMDGVRTDLSFTVFLTGPDSYEGGELVIEGAEGERVIKLPAGAMVLYPSTELHRVRPVTDGVRLAAVGWIESRIRRREERELLFDVGLIGQAIAAGREGAAPEAEALDGARLRVARVHANLLRLWAER